MGHPFNTNFSLFSYQTSPTDQQIWVYAAVITISRADASRIKAAEFFADNHINVNTLVLLCYVHRIDVL